MLFYAAALQTLNYDWDTLPVRRETPDRNLNLVEQIRERGGIVPAARREFGRHNEPLHIHSDVQLPPAPAFLRCLVLVRCSIRRNPGS